MPAAEYATAEYVLARRVLQAHAHGVTIAYAFPRQSQESRREDAPPRFSEQSAGQVAAVSAEQLRPCRVAAYCKYAIPNYEAAGDARAYEVNDTQ